MKSSAIDYEDEIDLQELFRVLWQRKLFIVVFVILTSALAFMTIKQLPNVYRSGVLIMLKKPTQSGDAIQSLISGSITAADSTETELELIKNKNLLSQVVTNLRLDNHPFFANQQLDENSDNHSADGLTVTSFQRALNHLSKNVQVQQKSGTDLILISYDSHDPSLSALVANNIGSTFIKYKESLMAGKHKQGAELLGTKLDDVKRNLEDAELKIVEYQVEHEFIDIKSAVTLANRKLTSLHAQKDKLLTTIEQSQILRGHILNNKNDIADLLSLPIFANSHALTGHQQDVKELTKHFEQIKLRYGPKHPKYIAAETMLLNTKKQLDYHVNQQLGKIDKQIQIEREQADFFESQIEKLSQRLNQLGVIEFDYEKLKREFEANLELYENLVKKQNESELMQDLTNSSNTILIESAQVNRTPVKPNRKLLMVLSILGSGLVACFIVLVEFLLANKEVQFRKLAPKFGTKVIGSVPRIKVKKKLKKQVLADVDESKHAGFIESIRSIRTSILLDKERAKHSVIAITSISPNDGKSTLSVQLSKCFAEVGETLLVDADLRFPSIATALQQEAERPGLTNLIANSKSYEDSIYRPFKYKFDVVTSGDIPKNPLVFLQHKRFKTVLNELKSRYQRVILECPPIMSVSDAFVVSKCVDSVYLVVDSTKANPAILANVLEELQQAEVEVGGIILNKVKDSKIYGAKKYYKYYRRVPSR